MKCRDRCQEWDCTFCGLNDLDTKKVHGGCDGEHYYEEADEGHHCTKCHFYDGIK